MKTRNKTNCKAAMRMVKVLPFYFFTLLLFYVLSPLTATAQKYVGGDISLLPDYETAKAKFREPNGSTITGDMINYFKQQGWNAMRVRLFVDPSKAPEDHKKQGVRQDLEYVKALSKRIKDAGLSLLLDFHYSDTWTDPGQHSTPSGWTSSDPEELAATLYQYTKDCLNELIAAGVTPDFVQPGNEITYGMLWPTGHCYPSGANYGTGTFDNFAKYLSAGIKAIREVCPQAKIVLQTELSSMNNVFNFCRTLKRKEVTDFDVIGISYYPYFHGELSTLKSTLNGVGNIYPDKKIQIVETGYSHAYYPDDAKYPISKFPNWPATNAGQLQFTKDLIELLNTYENVDGLYWWFPEANEYNVNWQNAVTPSGWYNASLFDNQTGKAMQALYELKTFRGLVVGDANNDYLVDVADVVAIVNYILEKPAENFNQQAADANGDGTIDVGDVVSVVNIILGN